MSAVTIQQMADRVAALMEERLRIKGRGLAEKLQRGGRALPRRVRAAAQVLAEAAHMAQNPKLLLQVDQEQIAVAYDLCVNHLNGVNRWQRRMGWLTGFAASVAFIVLVVGGLVVAVLVLRGYL
jgi:hypothetical protein